MVTLYPRSLADHDAKLAARRPRPEQNRGYIAPGVCLGLRGGYWLEKQGPNTIAYAAAQGGSRLHAFCAARGLSEVRS